jgi:CDP-paratose 2-epimerase
MKWLITGGAGFIGTNTVRSLAASGEEVMIVDAFLRKGSRNNLRALRKEFPELAVHAVDIRDFTALAGVFCESGAIDVVIHLAGQVAVTTSVTDPRTDFEINALGTFNVCEAVRLHAPDAVLINASTNKVYGGLEHYRIVEEADHYRYEDLPYGVPVTEPVDFHSPYGCSKGAADQYVRDYERIYNLRTVNFRQSCIFGPYQYGMEDQGWLAWFGICLLADRPITICGNGKQVRDVLFVEDLVAGYRRAAASINTIRGRNYNIGGGSERTISLLHGIGMLETIVGRKAKLEFTDSRPGDQRVFIADVRKAGVDFGWQPITPVYTGIEKMLAWTEANLDAILAERNA